MSIIKVSSLGLLILSYLALVMMFIYENELQDTLIPQIFIIWIIGAVNFALNITYGLKVGLKNILFISFVVSGLVWMFPPLMFTIFGIPFLVIYFVIGIYIHMMKHTAEKK